MSNQRLIAEFYYPLDLRIRDDPTGDHILVHLVRPLFDDLRRRESVDAIFFKRYIEGGSHIKMQIAGDPDSYETLKPVIRAAVSDYCHTHTGDWPEQMPMSDMARRVNQTEQREVSDRVTASPGDIRIYEMDVSETLAMSHEDEQVVAVDLRVQTLTCQHVLNWLALEPDMALRKAFVRYWLLDICHLCRISDRDMYQLGLFARTRWVDYFQLQGQINTYYQQYDRKEAAYHQFFARYQQQPDASALLSEPHQSLYRSFIRATRAMLAESQDWLYQADDAKLTTVSFLRLFNYSHLLHNRLSVGIYQEIFWSYVLEQIYAGRLSQADRNDIESYVHMVEAYQKKLNQETMS